MVHCVLGLRVAWRSFMDPVLEIKARLPIEQLVGEYCQLKKKGRNFVCLCPFHSDEHPSMLVSPDKGIAYCFPCQKGGDVFNFYQLIEGVDFPQAVKDLAEKVGVKLPEHEYKKPVEGAPERERIRGSLEAAETLYQQQLLQAAAAVEYLKARGVTADDVEQFGLGYAPDSFTFVYESLLKQDWSQKELLAAGLVAQQDLREGRTYDRFRGRIMIPIHDPQGRLVAFAGRTLTGDDAKYVNSPEGPLYHKSSVLYNFHRAKEDMRSSECAVMVEGYFDAISCARAGVKNVVAVSGTALTEEHVALLKRHTDQVTLCLDQDRAGRAAAERAFQMLAGAGLLVRAAQLPAKDPDELAQKDPAKLKSVITDAVPFLQLTIQELLQGDVRSLDGKRKALQHLAPLVAAVPSQVEREHELRELALVLQTTISTLDEDLRSRAGAPLRAPTKAVQVGSAASPEHLFTPPQIMLGLLLLYPHQRHMVEQLIVPEDEFCQAVAQSLREGSELPDGHRLRSQVLQLFLEEHDMAGWSESLAALELKRNCQRANQWVLQSKLRACTDRILAAQRQGKDDVQREELAAYQELLKLSRLAQGPRRELQ